MLEIDYLPSSLGLNINFIQYGELKSKMKILKSHYQLNRDPILLYSNNKPIESFVNRFINKTKRVSEIFTKQYIYPILTVLKKYWKMGLQHKCYNKLWRNGWSFCE